MNRCLSLIACSALFFGCRDDVQKTVLVEGCVFENTTHQGRNWHVITVDPAKARPSLQLAAADGKPLRDFAAFDAAAKAVGEETIWMMNAGMFHRGGDPVGLCICEGEERSAVNRETGAGNFFLKPNGIFYLTEQGAGVIDTADWPPVTASPILSATQSGPLLLHQGRFHPAIREGSPNRLIRNGVGVRKDGHLCFIISTEPVSFHEMATFFKESLACPNALYLDGVVSALYAPDAQLDHLAEQLGPVIGLWE